MAKYKEGDVVWAFFPYQESRNTKLRPVVILEILEDESFTCMITSTDRREENRGRWIEKDSPEGKEMGLANNSFINLDRTATINNIMIVNNRPPLGFCPFWEELYDEIQAQN